ncbi:MAG: uncharacterized protein JWO23_2310 [Solirubrobacterales bacterium]|nr:uncharacterized protein [Solirubrobacterales bacterium]
MLDQDGLTRKQRREQARAQRKALEAAERESSARRKRLKLGGVSLAGLAIAVVAVLIAAGGGGASPRVSGAGAGASLQVTQAPWAPEYSGLATRLAALKLPGQSDGGYHIHAMLRVYVNGKQIPVPANVGIDPNATSLAPLHTHDTSGIVHIESTEQYPFTLGQFFTIWGVKLTSSQLGGYVAGNGKALSVYANGELVHNPVGYVMNAHDDIVVGYGRPGSFPTSFQYEWPGSGL